MTSKTVIVHSVSLYQEDWDIIQRESNRMFGEGAPASCRSAAMRRILRDWDRIQRHAAETQIHLAEAAPCPSTS